MGFPGDSAVKELPGMQEMSRRPWFSPWIGKIPWRRKWPVFLPGEFHGHRRLAGYSSWCCQRVGHNEATKQQQQPSQYFIKQFECFWLIREKVMDSYKEILNQKTKIITLKYFFSVFLQMVTLCVCVCVCVYKCWLEGNLGFQSPAQLAFSTTFLVLWSHSYKGHPRCHIQWSVLSPSFSPCQQHWHDTSSILPSCWLLLWASLAGFFPSLLSLNANLPRAPVLSSAHLCSLPELIQCHDYNSTSMLMTQLHIPPAQTAPPDSRLLNPMK